MARRRKNELGDSFDLFLDTITNTFGGVLLIALLIVLMIQETKQESPETKNAATTDDIQLVESEISALEAKKAALQTGLKIQQEFEQDFQSDEVKELAGEVSTALAKKREKEQELSEMNADIKSSDAELELLTTKKGEADSRLQELVAKVEQIESELEKERQLKTRTANLPKEKATIKREVPIVIEGDEMFVINSQRDGFGLTINKNHFQTTTLSKADLTIDGQNIRTRIGSGIAIGSTGIQTELRQYDASDDYFAFVVRTDSFDKFSELRDSCVRLGFEYRLIVSDELIGESSGVGAKTQLP